jgi:hypothetical protein
MQHATEQQNAPSSPESIHLIITHCKHNDWPHVQQHPQGIATAVIAASSWQKAAAAARLKNRVR